MSLVIAALTMANLCLYFAVLCLTPYWPLNLWLTLGIILTLSASCGLACLARKKTALRLACCVLPLLALLFARTTVQLLWIAPAVVYAELMILSSHFSVSYWSYRLHYLWSSCVMLALLVVGLVAETPMSRSFPLALSALILGCFTLRQLRFGAETPLTQKALELASLAVVPAAVGLIAGLVGYGRIAMRWLLEWVFYPIFWLVQKGVEALIALFGQVQAPPEPLEPVTEEPFVMPEEIIIPEEHEVLPTQPIVRRDLRWLVRLALILAAATLVTYLIWRFYRYLKDHAGEESKEEPRITSQAEQPLPRSGEALSNRRRLRRIYGRYLRLLQKRGFVRRGHDTSQEILERSQDLAPEASAEALRALYIQARYSAGPVSSQQVQEARRLLRQLRE